MTSKDRPYDIVVWGATGFTGALVAEVLRDIDGVRWAIGGRSADKLANVARELNLGEEVGRIVADSMDRDSLDAMVSQTRVVASTVGPYARYGAGLVAACVQAETDYCDITGEATFVRPMIDAHHTEATARGVRIVHCCGFDSIPSDLGTLVVQREIQRRTGALATSVLHEIKKLKGAASGGTIATMANVFDEAKRDPKIRSIAGNPYALLPDGRRKGPRVSRQTGVRKRGDSWTAPFLMALPNEQIVRRSHALLNPDADHIDYAEVSSFGPGAAGLRRAGATASMLAGVVVGLGIGPISKLLRDRVLPSPGEGPSRDAIENGCLRSTVTGTTVDGDTVSVAIATNRDPGYGATATMLAQSAMCLAFDEPREDVLPGGILTPSAAMGMALVDRLNAADVTFTL